MDLPTMLLLLALGIWILARAWHARQKTQRILTAGDVAGGFGRPHVRFPPPSLPLKSTVVYE